ncbi:hypothetical protein BHM03_00024742 [Ensete ventricosum]|nr:hypothetical protein BHM03_00024742 [Ensete ventricosum]
MVAEGIWMGKQQRRWRKKRAVATLAATPVPLRGCRRMWWLFAGGYGRGSCSKGAVAIEERRGSGGHDCCRGGHQRCGWCWNSMERIAIADGSGRALLVGFMQQEIVAGYDQGRWRREIAAGSVV